MNTEELQIFYMFFRLLCSAILTLLERATEARQSGDLASFTSVESLSKLFWNLYWAQFPQKFTLSTSQELENMMRRLTHTYIDFLVGLESNPNQLWDIGALNLMARQFVTKKYFTNTNTPPISRSPR
jgi:hypothetical protein